MKKIALLLLIVTSIFGSALVVAGEFQRVQLRGESGTQRTAEISDVIFGPVSTNDTLWRIARDYRNSSEFAADRPASLYPVMYGIYVLNPKAFKDNNVNQLLDNAMLELPSPDFVAAINLEMARAKIEGDEDAVGYVDLTDSPNVISTPEPSSESISPQAATPPTSVTSTSVAPPIAKVVDANSAEKLEGFVAQQSLTSNELQILNELKNQYAVSLETIQVLLDENQLLSEQLQKVSQQLASLSNKVDGDVQEQLDAQAELQAQLYTLLQQANLLDQSEPASTFFNDIKTLLKEPMVLIASVSGIVLISLIALGMWLFARTPKATDAVPVAPLDNVDEVAPDIIELSEADLEVQADSLFIDKDDADIEDGSAVDDALTEELLNDELISDDLLSEELLSEDLLGEDLLGEELLDKDFLGDELLGEALAENNNDTTLDDVLAEDVFTETDDLEQQLRDQIEDIDFEESSGELDQSALDELFGSADLTSDSELTGDDDTIVEAIDVANDIDDILNEELIEPASDSVTDDDFDIDSLLEEVTEEAQSELEQLAPEAPKGKPVLKVVPEPVSSPENEVSDAPDEDEIPDELADLADELSRSALPDTLDIDEDAGLSEADVANLDLEISMQGENIDSTVDDLLNEIEQIEMMEGMLGESLSDDDDKMGSEPNYESESDNSDILDDELTNEILAELVDESAASDDIILDESDALADELLDELNAEVDMQEALTEDVLEELLNDGDLSEINDDITTANDTFSTELELEPEPEPEHMSKATASLLDDLPDI
ncbi:MAG: FimV/HubP family polar landmark protein, partial [Glaciecola sp.]|nr:FimV/HubP family polar landmark protein [Glaciecola sp.]